MNDELVDQPESEIPTNSADEVEQPEPQMTEMPSDLSEEENNLDSDIFADETINESIDSVSSTFTVDSLQSEEHEQGEPESETTVIERTHFEKADAESQATEEEEGDLDYEIKGENNVEVTVLDDSTIYEEEYPAPPVEDETDILSPPIDTDDDTVVDVQTEADFPSESVAAPAPTDFEQSASESGTGFGATIAGFTPPQRLILAILLLLDIMALVFAILYISGQITF